MRIVRENPKVIELTFGGKAGEGMQLMLLLLMLAACMPLCMYLTLTIFDTFTHFLCLRVCAGVIVFYTVFNCVILIFLSVEFLFSAQLFVIITCG